MPQILTELAIRAAKPPTKGTTTLWDSAIRNLGLRINHGGAKSFIVLIASGRRKTIGRYPLISLAEARTEAKRILAEKTLGRDTPPSITVDDALVLFLADAEKRTKTRTTRDYTRLLRRHLAKLFRSSLADVSTRDVAHIQDRLRDTPSEAAHALVAIKLFFNWCVRRGYVAINPCARLTAAKSAPRDRVLNDAELRLVYEQALTFPFPFGVIVRLLILTGQRRSEIGLLRWEWIDEEMVVFTKRIVRDKEDERASVSMLKTYHVFNVEQIEGLPDHIDDTDKMVIEPIEAAERFIAATKADIRLGGSKACYVPSHDFVALPPKDAFKNATNFYAIALHELGHWAGNEKRLNRDLTNRFGTRAYAAEELIAELNAAFLCAHLGIEGELRHAGYIEDWISLLRDDKRAIFTASSKASQAANHLRSYSEKIEDHV